MAVRENYPYKTDRAIEFVGPTDEITLNPLDFTNDAATCSFKVYDPDKDEAISVVEASGQTVLSVSNAGVFVVDDSIELTQDDDTIHASTVNAVDPVLGTVTIAAGTTDTAAVGNRFRVIFGAAVSMSEYGTAVLGARDFGFRGTLADTHPVHILDQKFDLEISFVGGAGLNALDVLCGIIKPRGECDPD